MKRHSGVLGCAGLLFLACLLPATGSTQSRDMRLPVVIDAESTRFDGNSSMVEFTGLKLTQGGISIEADEARASRTDFDDSSWNFSGNVVFDLEGGRIECDNANLHFKDFELQDAEIDGAPATFEFRREGAGESTHAEAAHLSYDVQAGVIEFSGNAVIREGGNRIASETLVYNILERRVNAVSSGAPDDRVKVTYTPPETAGDTGSEGDGDTDTSEEASAAPVTGTDTEEDDPGPAGPEDAPQ